MIRTAAPKLHAYVFVVAALVVAAFVVRRPDPIVIATPFAVVAAVGAARARAMTHVDASLASLTARAITGATVTLELEVRVATGASQVEAAIVLPTGLEPRFVHIALGPLADGARRVARLNARCTRWGAFTAAIVAVRAWPPGRFFSDEVVLRPRFDLRVYPRLEHLRTLVAPRDVQRAAGSIVARARGQGLEFADLRPYAAGDDARAINWRASARAAAPLVNQRHADRSGDVVIVLDTFTDVETTDSGTLDLAVRAATAVAAPYLQDRERVGLIEFGGTLRWLEPGTGARQLYRIVDTLIATQVFYSYAWKDVSVIPHRTLPANALVVAITPLVDRRGVELVFDLLRRRFDVVVLDLPPATFLPRPLDARDQLARRIWLLERSAILARYRELGAGVASWPPGMPIDGPIEEVRRWRRTARLRPAN